MGKHKFKISVEHLEDQKGSPANDPPLVFLAENHDDILALAARTGASGDKDRAFLVGLKLLGEVLLEDRNNPLYHDFIPHFGEFMKRIKQSRTSPG